MVMFLKKSNFGCYLKVISHNQNRKTLRLMEKACKQVEVLMEKATKQVQVKVQVEVLIEKATKQVQVKVQVKMQVKVQVKVQAMESEEA